MKYILNLTGVPATPEQVFDGVIELANSELKERLVNALSFDKVPLFKEVEERAELIEDIFVEDTEIRTGLKLKEISKNSGKEIPLWSKLKEMDIGVMLNTDTFMVSMLDEVLSNSAKVMYSVFKTGPDLDYSNNKEQAKLNIGDKITISVLNSIIIVDEEKYNIRMIANAERHTGLDKDSDTIQILSYFENGIYEFRRITRPNRVVGHFKIIGKNDVGYPMLLNKGSKHIGFYCSSRDS